MDLLLSKLPVPGIMLDSVVESKGMINRKTKKSCFQSSRR